MVEKILVSGANGFVAANAIKELLTNGYAVRGQVRSESSGKKVKEAHAEYAGDNLEIVIVKDITAPGAFDEAVKGVEGIFHTASPFVLNAVDFDKELFDPAVQGTVGILKSAKEHGSSVKRVVITSSFASILDFAAGLRPGYVYSEKDWNPMTREEAKAAGPVAGYLTSKVLAEKAGFDFVETEKPSFSIATVCPPMVYGPIAQDFDDLHHLNESTEDFYNLFNGSKTEVPATGFWAYADVRDLALAHRLAYEKPEAANQRFLIANRGYSYQVFVDALKEKFPELASKIPSQANPANEAFPAAVYKVDNSKARDVLGINFRPLEDTIVDSVKYLQRLEKKLGVTA
jgi:nucleoside-diphosphate-sugar epimerase